MLNICFCRQVKYIILLLVILILIFFFGFELDGFNILGASLRKSSDTNETINPSSQVVIFSTEPSKNIPLVSSTQALVSQSTEVFNGCDGFDWELCWEIDDENQTIRWIGVATGVGDIGQVGVALEKIQIGYTAIVTLEKDLTINICAGTIDGTKPGGSCPKELPILAGTHQIISPGGSGGFRIYQ